MRGKTNPFLGRVQAWLILAAPLVWVQGLEGQKYDPVQWNLELGREAAAGDRVLGRLTATVEAPWHLYSPSTPPGGPIPTKLELEPSPFVASYEVYQPEPESKFDRNFQLETETYDGQPVFLFDIQLADSAQPGEAELTAKMRYQACTDKLCLPPKRKSVVATLAIRESTSTAVAELVIPEGYRRAIPAQAPALGAGTDPVTASTVAPEQAASEDFVQFAMVAFGFGLLAIFTPCVFPMIPITMSYFVSTQSGSPRASVFQAVIFCFGVIVMFTGLGTIVSVTLGPFGLTELGSNVWVNLFIALIFTAFAASLLGAFEITVPSSALTKLNAVSNRGGVVGTLTMGLVFALASFACTGPFVGTLLAGSITGDLTWPILGMLIFSTGLALPFFFLALFPSYLAKLPKGGGWLSRTKVTMGFIILAVAVKYFSNVDQVFGWNLLSRELFLAVWIVLATLAGLYLLGILRLGDAESSPIGLGRLAVGGACLVLGVSLLPGMFGARLGELDAYVPSPLEGSLGGLLASGAEKTKWIKDDYEKALAEGRDSGKNVLISFTGYTCTNCKWMKTNMFTEPEIAGLLGELVLLELYTDGLDAASEENQELQLSRFGTVAIPYYAIVSPDGAVLDQFAGSTRDVSAYQTFLEAGVPGAAETLSLAGVSNSGLPQEPPGK